MVRLSLLLLLALPALAFAEQPVRFAQYWVFFGCYTDGKTSKGVYRAELDTATGKLSAPELAAVVGSPSFLHIAPDGKTLYAVGEAAGKDGGGVYSWKLDPATGKLSDQVSLTSKGAGPCHISTDNANKFAVVANYGGGSTAVFKLKPDGSLDSRTGFLQHDKPEKGAPHGHCGFFDNTGTLAFVPDLGLNRVLIHKLNRDTGTIAPHDPAFVQLPAGSGPRHIHLAPDNSVAFACGETDMTVNVIKMDAKANKYELVQSASTLPDGEKKAAGQSTAECRIHPNGKFVYVSNRGHNTVAAFKYDAAAMRVSLAGHIAGDIKTPRNFNVTPDGGFMLIASQDGDKVGVYKIDTATGLAKETEFSAKVAKPVCVKFLAKP